MSIRAARILDFDCENRPLSYLGRDFTTPELTVVAWKLLPRGDMMVMSLTHDTAAVDMAEAFREVYDQADMVTGHNIIRHDLRLLNAMLLEGGRPPLAPTLVCDTYRHLKKRAPGFASQGDLAAYLGVKAVKVGMGTPAWRAANRLNGGAEIAEARAVGDVRQHIELRAKLVELGWLHSPKPWPP